MSVVLFPLELFITGFYLHASYVFTLIPLLMVVLCCALYVFISRSFLDALKTSLFATGIAFLTYVFFGAILSLMLIGCNYPAPSLAHPPSFYGIVTFFVSFLYSMIQARFIWYNYSKQTTYKKIMVVCGISSCISASLVTMAYLYLFG